MSITLDIRLTGASFELDLNLTREITSKNHIQSAEDQNKTGFLLKKYYS